MSDNEEPARRDPECVSADDARQALCEVESIVELTRRQIGHGCAAPILILWGVIWIIGYAVSHRDALLGAQVWPMLAAAGGIASWIIGARHRSPTRNRSNLKIGLAWCVLAVFAALWLIVLLPAGVPEGMSGDAFSIEFARKVGAYFALVPMFAYVIAGLWMGRFLLYLGSVVSLLVVLSYFLLPEWSLLATGTLGGGALIASGVFIRRVWR